MRPRRRGCSAQGAHAAILRRRDRRDWGAESGFGNRGSDTRGEDAQAFLGAWVGRAWVLG